MSLTHGSKPSNTQPRKDPSKLTKGEKRLERRIDAYEQLNKSSLPTEYHRPGSKKK